MDRDPSRRPRMRGIWAMVKIGELVFLVGLAAIMFGHVSWLHPIARAGVLFGAVLALGSLNAVMARRFMDDR